MTNAIKHARRMKKLRLGHQPLTHRNKKAEFQWELMQEHAGLRYKYRKPDNLTILTCHDHEGKSLFEENMDYLGVMNYVVLRWPKGELFRSAHRLRLVWHYLKSCANKTDYVLFCDADDVIFTDEPTKAVEVLEREGCDVLFCSTMFKGGWICMPEVYEWVKSVAKRKGRYLNAGVYIGKWDAVIKVLGRALDYLTKGSMTPQEYYDSGRGGKSDKLCKELPDFPMGATDQLILRYIHREFYPIMDVDYHNRLVYRN